VSYRGHNESHDEELGAQDCKSPHRVEGACSEYCCQSPGAEGNALIKFLHLDFPVVVLLAAGVID